MNEYKEKIIKIFRENVKGKKVDISCSNQFHDGKKGHWLEHQFNILPNADNKPDLYGYELKNETSSKTTFGDWSANRYIFKDGEFTEEFVGKNYSEKQDHFCMIFGKKNEKKDGRYSWSGTPVPQPNMFNAFGQILIIEDNLDITARYYFDLDRRPNKFEVVPKSLQKNNLELARWFGITSPSTNRKDKCIKSKLEDKFYVNGWFTCKTDNDNIYNKICFGKKIDYKTWIELVRDGTVFFDSGMYQGNKRPYSQWRANNNFWDSLIIETYE